jgi:branched-chain amino acid transport system permease protein
VQLLVNIVVLASIYALIACGYVLIYRVSRVLNLAHGELMMLGGYLLLATASLFAGQPLVAIGVAALMSLLVGILIYVLLMRKMAGEMVLAAVLTTVALGILVRGVVILVWSAQQQYPGEAMRLANPALALPGGGRISTFAAALVVANVLVYGALFLFLQYGRWGVRMGVGACACARPDKMHCSPRNAVSTCMRSMPWHGGCRPSPARLPAC